MSVLLTDESVPALAVKPGQHNTLYTDSKLPGFGCRASPSRRAWTVQHKVKAPVDDALSAQYRGFSQRTCIGYWPHMNANAARNLAEAVIEVCKSDNLHPTEALRCLTGNGSRGVVGDRPKTRPGIVNWQHMAVTLEKAVEFTYLLWLEARFGDVSCSGSSSCSEEERNDEGNLAQGLHACLRPDHGGPR